MYTDLLWGSYLATGQLKGQEGDVEGGVTREHFRKI
jgi:hypothetical protein